MKNNHHNPLAGLPRAEGPGHAPVLGELEVKVMEVLWNHEALTALAVLDALSDRVNSLSTVQSTLERLVRKKLLARTKQGRAYIYRAAIDREELISLMIRDVAMTFSGGRITPMVSGFCSFVEENGRKKSRGLSTLLRDYIKGLKNK